MDINIYFKFQEFNFSYSMNDSGYSTPPKPAGPAPEETQFLIKTKNSNSTADKAAARNDEILGHVVLRKVPEMKLDNTLLWAKLRGHDGKIFWVPFSLPCGFIQMKTEIEWEKISGKVYDYVINLDHAKPYSKPQSELTKPSSCKLFFVSLNRKHKTAITHVDRKILGRDVDICVIASPDQTFKEAFMKDGRFKNIERFTLGEKVEGGVGPTVDINDKIGTFGGVVLEVAVKRTAQPSHTKLDCPTSAESSSTKDGATVEQDVSQSSKKLNELRKENVVYVFPKSVSELSTEEMLYEMEQCFRARALDTLVGPKNRGAKEVEKSFEKLAKIQLAKYFIGSARPVAVSKLIHNFFDSVGYIRCGSVEATCFLVSNAMIATSYHVIAMMEKTGQSQYSNAFAYFNYEKHGEKNSLSNGYKLRPLSYEGNVMSEEFDYAFLFLEDFLQETLTLGQFVKCKEPQEGNMFIIGHPNGDAKKDEICPILPLHELENRLADPSFYLCRSEIRNLYHDESALSYDVGCMFEGSSGSPVFDMDGSIVAIHTLGYRFGARNVMEVGLKCRAFIDDLERRGLLEFVAEHFPFCYVENMET